MTRRGMLLGGVLAAGGSLAGCTDLRLGAGEYELDSIESSLETRIREVGEDVRESVVRVGRGTGWIVEPDRVLTCSHVVGSDSTELSTLDGRQLEGTVVGRHESVDLALVESDLGDRPALPRVGDFDPDENADTTVVQVGHPAAVGSWVISFGSIIGSHGNDVLLDIPCGPGGSGSPLVSLAGRVLGTTLGTTVMVEQRSDREQPENLYESFPGQRLVARAASPAEIERCLDHLT